MNARVANSKIVSGRHMQAYTGNPIDLARLSFDEAFRELVERYPEVERADIKIQISAVIKVE